MWTKVDTVFVKYMDQGWNANTERDLLYRFLEKEDDSEKEMHNAVGVEVETTLQRLDAFLSEMADEENRLEADRQCLDHLA